MPFCSVSSLTACPTKCRGFIFKPTNWKIPLRQHFLDRGGELLPIVRRAVDVRKRVPEQDTHSPGSGVHHQRSRASPGLLLQPHRRDELVPEL